MALWRMILKEIGGRVQNAAGTIDSNKNMFYGSKNNAPSDKMANGLGGGGGGMGGLGGLGGNMGPQMSGGAAEGAGDAADAASGAGDAASGAADAADAIA